MERKIGEIFNYQDNLYQCIKSITCTNCGFNNKGCLADKHITGDCSGRLDGASGIYRKPVYLKPQMRNLISLDWNWNTLELP